MGAATTAKGAPLVSRQCSMFRGAIPHGALAFRLLLPFFTH
jgi:hypothetical protein